MSKKIVLNSHGYYRETLQSLKERLVILCAERKAVMGILLPNGIHEFLMEPLARDSRHLRQSKPRMLM